MKREKKRNGMERKEKEKEGKGRKMRVHYLPPACCSRDAPEDVVYATSGGRDERGAREWPQ
jgi:hypothetical protein